MICNENPNDEGSNYAQCPHCEEQIGALRDDFPHPDREGKILWRPYSISSNPEQKEYLELYIRWAQKPVLGKFTTMLWDLGVGDHLSVW